MKYCLILHTSTDTNNTDVNILIYPSFIDFEKAFDKIRQNKLISIQQESEVDNKDT